MKAIISTTYDDKYLYFLPITTWLWNQLGVEVICFMPKKMIQNDCDKINLQWNVFRELNSKIQFAHFESPKHKEATYAQCSRLYGACLDLPEDEVLITSDIDMGLFKIPQMVDEGFSVFGADLVPVGQYPICYISAKVSEWRKVFNLQYGALSANDGALPTIETKAYQQCLDELLGNIDCENMRGNYWGKDQEEAFQKISNTNGWLTYINRSNGQNQFATKRYDRDDSFIDQRLNPDMIDYHFHRPGFQENSFNIILVILKYHYPNESFDWLIEYNKKYKALL